MSGQHAARGQARIVRQCSLPLTSLCRIDLLVTELAVTKPSDDGLILKERVPGVTLDEIRPATVATLLVPEMALAAA